MAQGSWSHPTGTRWGRAGTRLAKVAGRVEVPFQLVHLLGQDALLSPRQVPATLQLAHLFPEPLILQHELLEHPVETPLGPGQPGPTLRRGLGV